MLRTEDTGLGFWSWWLPQQTHDPKQVSSSIFHPSSFESGAPPRMRELIRSQRCEECLHPPCIDSSTPLLNHSSEAAKVGRAVRFITVATDQMSCRFDRFDAFARAAGLNLSVLSPRRGFDCLRPPCPGGFHAGKLYALVAATAALPPTDLVFYSDSYDAIVVVPPGEEAQQSFWLRYELAVQRQPGVDHSGL